jgi:hypothetical protein
MCVVGVSLRKSGMVRRPKSNDISSLSNLNLANWEHVLDQHDKRSEQWAAQKQLFGGVVAGAGSSLDSPNAAAAASAAALGAAGNATSALGGAASGQSAPYDAALEKQWLADMMGGVGQVQCWLINESGLDRTTRRPIYMVTHQVLGTHRDSALSVAVPTLELQRLCAFQQVVKDKELFVMSSADDHTLKVWKLQAVQIQVSVLCCAVL